MKQQSPIGEALRIIAFCAVVIGGFVAIASYFFRLSGGATFTAPSGEVSAEAGAAIYAGNGKCATCHAIGDDGAAVRCPNLGVKAPFTAPIAVRAAERVPGLSAVEYLVQACYEPDAHVVEGFPRGVMPPIHRPPLALTDDEIRAVLLYLLERSGLPADDDAARRIERAQRKYAGTGGPSAAEAVAALVLPKGNKRAGKRAFEEQKCRLCHVVRGETFEQALKGGIGPELTGIGAIQNRQYLFQSILVPNAVVLSDPSPEHAYSENGKSKMPDFGLALTLQQAVDIVEYLKSLTEPPPGPPINFLPQDDAGPTGDGGPSSSDRDAGPAPTIDAGSSSAPASPVPSPVDGGPTP